jgi:hemerythrin
MSLLWDESLVLGIEEIDNQHHAIFEQFELFSEAVQQRKSNESIEQLAGFLIEHAHVHFSTEEKIMAEFRYPNIDIQRHEHKEFERDASELKKRVEQEGATREIAIRATGTILRWIIQHIKTHDKEMVEYVKGCVVV